MTTWSGNPSKFKVYWFSRDLVASRFGGFATSETGALRDLSEQLERDLSQGKNIDELLPVIENALLGSVSKLYAGEISKRYRQTEDLYERITRRIDGREDIKELQVAIDAVVRTTEILKTTPVFGQEEIENIVENSLRRDGETDPSLAYDALYNVDIEGEAYQLGAQREPLNRYVGDLLDTLEGDSPEVASIVSAIAQEYERRAGQSRAATAGNVLETALQHIFDVFGIRATGSPSHQGDLELDNVVRGPAGSIGFSCKRTLRERFRQSLSREAEIDVDQVWFVSLLMADVSREKLQDIHNDGSKIYVPRDSFVWDRYNEEEELATTLRPADQFLFDLIDATGASADLIRDTTELRFQ